MEDFNHTDSESEDYMSYMNDIMERLAEVADIIDFHLGVPKELEDSDGSSDDV